jgi:hypothetical protein
MMWKTWSERFWKVRFRCACRLQGRQAVTQNHEIVSEAGRTSRMDETSLGCLQLGSHAALRKDEVQQDENGHILPKRSIVFQLMPSSAARHLLLYWRPNPEAEAPNMPNTEFPRAPLSVLLLLSLAVAVKYRRIHTQLDGKHMPIKTLPLLPCCSPPYRPRNDLISVLRP